MSDYIHTHPYGPMHRQAKERSRTAKEVILTFTKLFSVDPTAEVDDDGNSSEMVQV